MKKSGLVTLCAVAIGLGLSAAPAAAETLKNCNAEWSGMKANKTVGDQKYADFRKECLARTAAAPAEPAPTPPAPTAKAAPAKPAPKTKAATAPVARDAPAEPATPGEAVFPDAVSDKYTSESAGKARMHTCLDQYNENKAGTGNGGLRWIQKGGGYYSQCNKHLKG